MKTFVSIFNTERRMNIHNVLHSRSLTSISYSCSITFCLIILLSLECAFGQNLVNTGQITLRGTLRIEGTATNLPDSVGGTIEYYGADQSFEAIIYKNLLLSGSGEKTTHGGNIKVNGYVSVAPSVLLNIDSSATILLGDSIVESGYIQGQIRKTVVLSSSTPSSNFGNIGSTISWTTRALDTTVVTRHAGVAIAANSTQSIKRWYSIAPKNNSRLQASLAFHYDNRELNGHSAPALELWRSIDNGQTWRRQGGTIDTAHRTITKSGVVSFSRWTAADTMHLLGSAFYEWKPFAFTSVTGNNQLGGFNSDIAPFSLKVIDAFGNPLEGIPVSFAITGAPSGTTGDSLSAPNTFTDSSGYASTVLHLGSDTGMYYVEARVQSVAPFQFRAQAMIIAGDANNDFDVNIADITTLIDCLRGKDTLSHDQLLRCDINHDQRFDTSDIFAIRDMILRGSTILLPNIQSHIDGDMKMPVVPLAKMVLLRTAVAVDSSEAITFEITSNGLRINLKNHVPINGFQLYLRLHSNITITQPDLIFKRSQMMNIAMRTNGNELRVIAFNLQNTPIAPDSGSLFRLPLMLTALSDIDTVAVVLSTNLNKVVTPVTSEATATPGTYPTTFSLLQNYPNPFNNQTTIIFNVPDMPGKMPKVLLFVYNILGQKVKTLLTGEQESVQNGQRITWNGTNDAGQRVASGVYFYRLMATGYVSTKKMVLIK